MKKIVSLLLCAALLAAFVPAVFAADASTKGAYKHVVIVGIDGAGRFVEQADTPEFDRIFKNGALTYAYSTASGQTVNLSLDEIVKRLNQIIEAELNVPFGTEIDHVKVKLCCSLLYKLDGLDEPDDAEIEKSKEEVRKRVIRRKNRLSM